MDDYKIALGAILDANAKGDIDKQLNAIKDLSVTISKATLSNDVINDIKRQLTQNGIDLKLVFGNVNQITNQAKQTGQQIGKLISDSAEQAISNVSSKNIGKYFRIDSSTSNQFRTEMEKLVSEWTNAKGKLTDLNIQTRTSYDEEAKASITRLHQATVTYKNELDEVIKKTIAWRQIGITTNDKGEEEILRGFVEVAGQYSKSLDTATVKTDKFVDRQKQAVSNLKNTLSTIESKFNDPGATKHLTDTTHISDVQNKIAEVNNAITTLQNSNKSTFTQAKTDVEKLITELNNLITKYQNAEYAATSLRTKDIQTIKIDEGNNLNAFVQKMEQSGHYTDDLKQKVSTLRAQLNGVFDANTLTSYLNGLSNIQSEFKAVDATAKTVEKSTKLQTNIDAEKKVLKVYVNQLKEAGVYAGDVKTKIEKMFSSLSKVGSQSGLTTWRAELKGVKAETDAVLKSVQKTTDNSNLEKLNADIKTLTNNLNNFSSNNTGFKTFKIDIDGVEVSLDSLIQKLSTVKNTSDLGTIRSQAEALKTSFSQLQEVNKIQLQLDTGAYQSKVDSLIARTNQWVDANGNARISTESLKAALDNLSVAHNNLNSSGGNTVANQQVLIAAEEALNVEVKKVQSSVTSMNATMAKSTAVDALRQKVQMFYDTNLKAHWKWGKDLKSIMTQLASGAEVPITKMRQLEQEFIRIQNSARQAGKLGLSFFDTIKQGISKFSYWTSSTFLVMKSVQEIKQMISTVKELDEALTNISYTMDVSNKQLEKIGNSSLEMAKALHTSASNVLDAVKTYANANETAESILNKARATIMMSNVSGMGTEQTVDIIQGTVEQFDLSDTEEQLMHISDVLQTVSANMPMDFAKGLKELSEGIQTSGQTARQAGYDLESYSALLGTLISKTRQSGSELGRSLRTKNCSYVQKCA